MSAKLIEIVKKKVSDMDCLEYSIWKLYMAGEEYGADDAAAELARLQAIEKAAKAFICADGRQDPQGKYLTLRRFFKDDK